MILRFRNIVCEYFCYKSDIDAGRHEGWKRNTRAVSSDRLLFSHQRIFTTILLLFYCSYHNVWRRCYTAIIVCTCDFWINPMKTPTENVEINSVHHDKPSLYIYAEVPCNLFFVSYACSVYYYYSCVFFVSTSSKGSDALLGILT